MTPSPTTGSKWLDSFRVRLVATTLLVVVLPLLIVSGMLERWTYQSAEEQSLQLQRQASAVVESEVRATIIEVQEHLILLDEVLGLNGLSRDEQRSILHNLLSSQRIYHELVLAPVDGADYIRVSRVGRTQRSNLVAEGVDEAIVEVSKTGTSYFGPVEFDEHLREPVTALAVPLRNRRSGAVETVLVATVRFKPVWDLLGELSDAGDSDVYLVNAGGLIVAHANPAVVLRGTQIDLPVIEGHTTGLAGEDVVISAQPLEFGERTLLVVAEQETSMALSVADRNRSILMMVAVGALLLTFALVAKTARYFVRPIEGLVFSASKVAAGDFKHRADEGAQGEAGQLARAFNTMTTQLAALVGSLEARVKERTAQLEASTRVQAQLITQLEAQAAHDFLTGLPNRYTLHTRLEVELVRARRSGSRVAVLLIDLDNFKDVNDTFGHAVGDELLIAVGARLQDTLREVDLICRLGGDEFAVVQTDIGGKRGATDLAERLLRAFTESFTVSSEEIFTTLSIGVSVTDSQTATISDIMQQADLALYRAKDAGRNTYRFFEDAMDTEIKRRMSLTQDLHQAVERGELFLEYQPQVGLGDRRIAGSEALLRWNHPELGVVSPIELVPLAERGGLIDAVGEWVLRTACLQAQSWQGRDLPALPMAVNVSAVQLRDPDFVAKVSRALADSGLDPRYLELELTEGVLIASQAYVDETLATLHEIGVGITLDDFGRGYASLDYLRRYPLSKVKIDRSFVHDMLTNVKNASIVSSVIDLSAKLHLDVIAEGVERSDLLERLSDEGCEAVQGFYFSRPVSADAFEKLLVDGSERIEAHGVSLPASPVR